MCVLVSVLQIFISYLGTKKEPPAFPDDSSGCLTPGCESPGRAPRLAAQARGSRTNTSGAF